MMGLSTRSKIYLASKLKAVIVFARALARREPLLHARRHGVNWRLDLNEGIDFGIYLGFYQKIPQRVVDAYIRPGSLVIDIGANIGSHALPLARCVGPPGRVVAVEPTDYAFSKLAHNASLNPDMAERLVLVQAALTAGTELQEKTEFYASWPLGGTDTERHRKHRGVLVSADGARFVALDLLLAELRSSGRIAGPVKFIKMDVDGPELDILRGGRETITGDRPAMLIEIQPHTQDEVLDRFDAFIETLRSYGYGLETAASGQMLPMSAAKLRKLIRDGAHVDAVAVPIDADRKSPDR